MAANSISAPLVVVFSARTTLYLTPLLSWHIFHRMKASSFHHLCQRSSLSPNCQQGRTGVWTQLWTNNGKKPGNVWWQQSALHQYDRTPPRKVQTALKSTCPRPKPASESKPAQIIGDHLSHIRLSLTQNTQTDLRRKHTDVQRMHRGWSLTAAQIQDRRNVGITGQQNNPP